MALSLKLCQIRRLLLHLNLLLSSLHTDTLVEIKDKCFIHVHCTLSSRMKEVTSVFNQENGLSKLKPYYGEAGIVIWISFWTVVFRPSSVYSALLDHLQSIKTQEYKEIADFEKSSD